MTERWLTYISLTKLEFIQYHRIKKRKTERKWMGYFRENQSSFSVYSWLNKEVKNADFEISWQFTWTADPIFNVLKRRTEEERYRTSLLETDWFWDVCTLHRTMRIRCITVWSFLVCSKLLMDHSFKDLIIRFKLFVYTLAQHMNLKC